MRQYKGALSFEDARAALMTTALPVENYTPSYGLRTEPVAHVGAGELGATWLLQIRVAPLGGVGHISPPRTRMRSILARLPAASAWSIWLPTTNLVCLVTATGLIQVHATLVNKVKINPYQINIPSSSWASERKLQSRIISVTNLGRRPVAYRLSHRPAVSIPVYAAWCVGDCLLHCLPHGASHVRLSQALASQPTCLD